MQFKTFSVSQANRLIKNAIDVESLLKSIAITGEISNLKYHSTGHIYFSLKDESNVLSCVMFKRNADFLPFKLENGQEVMAVGEVNFFERNGTVTLNCEVVMPKGQGNLNLKFEELKAKLEKEGMFDYKNKVQLPKFPEKVAVVTSATGAVIEDIKNVANRRNKNIEIILCPVKVQGIGAEAIISQTLEYLNKHSIADVIIIARGGGSKEDLAPFNTEIVARSVFNSKIPTVSAVGHETDITLCDLVADCRASTPSEAAEIVFPLSEQMKEYLKEYERRLSLVVERRISEYKAKLINIKDYELYNKAMVFVKLNKNEIENKNQGINHAVDSKITSYKNDLMVKIAKVEKYNPVSIISQGYSLVQVGDNVIESVDNLKVKDKVTVKLKDGEIKAIVEDIKKNWGCNG